MPGELTEVEALTDGRFTSVSECAAYLYDRAYPCEVPLGDDRELCLDLGVAL